MSEETKLRGTIFLIYSSDVLVSLKDTSLTPSLTLHSSSSSKQFGFNLETRQVVAKFQTLSMENVWERNKKMKDDSKWRNVLIVCSHKDCIGNSFTSQKGDILKFEAILLASFYLEHILIIEPAYQGENSDTDFPMTLISEICKYIFLSTPLSNIFGRSRTANVVR